jgi:ferredoxin-thioredoxin reductase catalytic subunit
MTRSYDGSEMCMCGDVFDEHDENHACTVADCPCFYFELNEDPGGED